MTFTVSAALGNAALTTGVVGGTDFNSGSTITNGVLSGTDSRARKLSRLVLQRSMEAQQRGQCGDLPG